MGLMVESPTGCTVSCPLSNVTEAPGKVSPIWLFEENPNKLLPTAREVQRLPVS